MRVPNTTVLSGKFIRQLRITQNVKKRRSSLPHHLSSLSYSTIFDTNNHKRNDDYLYQYHHHHHPHFLWTDDIIIRRKNSTSSILSQKKDDNTTTANNGEKRKIVVAGSDDDGRRKQQSYDYEVYTVQRDFFEEPVTFLSKTNSNNNSKGEIEIGTFMATMDSHTMAIVTHGKSVSGNGDEFGISRNAAHAISITWAEIIRLSKLRDDVIVPMAIVTILSPLLAQTGVAYLQFLDQILHKTFHTTTITTATNNNHNHNNNNNISESNNSNNSSSSMLLMDMAKDLIAIASSSSKNNELGLLLSIREQYHIQVLQHLLNDNHKDAMIVLYHLLEECPGDILALSLAMDVAHTLGDRQAPLRVATSVASYYNERGRRSGYLSQPSLSSHNIGSAYVALGLAVGGKIALAEQKAEQTSGSGAGALDIQNIGGITAHAMAHVYDAEGRVSEGNSQLSTFDGANSYEGCGWLFTDSRLTLKGAKFTLDREGSSADRSALRMYDENVERILEYSAFSSSQPPQSSFSSNNNHHHSSSTSTSAPLLLVDSFPTRKVPRSKRDGMIRAVGGAAKSFLSGDFIVSFFGGNNTHQNYPNQTNNNNNNDEDTEASRKEELLSEIEDDAYLNLPAQTLEDVLSWLPPTPQLLTDATLLLLRLTISGAIEPTNYRWNHLKLSWEKILLMHHQQQQKQPVLSSNKMAQIAFSLVIDDDKFNEDNNYFCPAEESTKESIKVSTKLVEVSRLLRQLMNIGGGVSAESDDDQNNLKNEEDEPVKVVLDEKKKSEWLRLNDLLIEIRDGKTKDGQYLERDFEGWDMEIRPFLEYITFYTATITEDYHALCHARSVCSESIIFRPNSPEAWWKYSVILDKLGDTVAAEDARSACVSLGSGEGGAVVH